MARFFVSRENILDKQVIISGEDVKHITKVLRLGPGDNITVLDGLGSEYQVVLETVEKERITGRILSQNRADNEAPIRVNLIQGLPKGEKMELIIQKAVELGVSRIIPVETDRSVVKLDNRKAGQRQERWQRIALEAAKQSRRALIPIVEPVMPLKEALAGLPPEALILMPWEEASKPFKPLLEGVRKGLKDREFYRPEVYIIIGPEGGFTPEEARDAGDAGALTLSLGPRILRTETAGLAVIAVVMYELGDLGGGVNAKKAAIYTLGCKVNQTESEAMARLFTNAGYEVVEFQEYADVYVINTCTVTHLGDRKSRQMIRRAKKTNPEAVVTVTGCYAQTSPGEVLAIPGVDLIIGTRDRERLLDLVEQTRAVQGPVNAVKNIMEAREFEELPLARYSAKTRAFVKIQEGCNNFCSYCIIPYARGPLRSRRPDKVIEEVNQLVTEGFKEVVLTGIHTGAYGRDLGEPVDLNGLMAELAQISGLARLRLSSIEPNDISPKLIETFAREPVICNHFHIPLQSGSDTILKKMNRKYTKGEFRQLLKVIRDVIPGVGITSDIIAGFPGETEELFQESLEFVKEMAFGRLHVFKYSPRKGTPAATFPQQVSPREKEDRSGRLIALGNRMAEEFAHGFISQTMTVLAEESPEAAEGRYEGYTENYLRVEFQGPKEFQGELVQVLLTGVIGDKVYGEIL